MGWNDESSGYPDQRPGSAWSDRREDMARILAEKPRRESWRDKAARLGINARSFDDLYEQIDYQDDQCKMAQLEHKAESKCTDLQLSHPGEVLILDRFTCSFCGHEGTESELLHPQKSNGDGLGEWVCRAGVGCRHDEC